MKAVFRFIAANNFVPIVISFVCFRHFSTLNNQPPDYFLTFGASFFCWLFYLIDKIKDNKNRTFLPTDRHYLSPSDKIIQWTLGILLAIITGFHFHLFSITYFSCLLLAIPISFIYLLMANASLKIPKEIFASLIIAVTLCLLPILMNGDTQNLSIFPIFFLMIFGNMLLIGIVERHYDQQYQFKSLSGNYKKQHLIAALFGLFILMVLLLFISGQLAYTLWVMGYCGLYAIILLLRKKVDINLLHVLSDMVFLGPLFL